MLYSAFLCAKKVEKGEINIDSINSAFQTNISKGY